MDAMVIRLDEGERRISDVEDKLIENNEAEKKRDIKAKEHDLRIREISNSLKRNNIRIIKVPEEEEREIGVEGLCEQIIGESFPNLEKDRDIKIQEAQRIPIRFEYFVNLTMICLVDSRFLLNLMGILCASWI